MRYSILAFFTLACGSDNEIQVQRKELRTSENTYDAGIVAVGDRYTFPITLQSIGPGSVTIYDIQSSDPEHFVILPSWKEEDSDRDGELDSVTLQRGSIDTPTQLILEVNFRPDADALFKAQVTLISNDNTTIEQTEDGDGIWRAAIRGIGKVPCAEVFPKVLDFGAKPAGGYFSEELQIRNCGEAPLTLSSFQFENSTSFYGASSTPIYIFPEESKTADIAWVPGNDSAEAANLFLVINDPNLVDPIPLLGNSCEDSILPDWDADSDGWTVCGGDCDDDNENINPSIIEITNSKDDNCDGNIDESIASDFDSTGNVDDDGDGFTETDGDCDDSNADVSPDATEEINQIDDNCDGFIDNYTTSFDDDNDGLSEREGDCDDDNDAVFPNQEEVENAIDDNCNGKIDEGSDSFDDDGDGYAEEDGDCDDADPWTWPSSDEDCDGIDNDCDGLIDEGSEEEENGACAFVVERQQTTTLEPQGCSTAVSSKRALPILIGLLFIAVGRRETMP